MLPSGTLGLGSAYIISKKARRALFAHTDWSNLRRDLRVAVRGRGNVFPEGFPRHVLAGKVFVASMLTMAVAAVYRSRVFFLGTLEPPIEIAFGGGARATPVPGSIQHDFCIQFSAYSH